MKTINLDLGKQSYNICIENKLRFQILDILRKQYNKEEKLVFITDENVYKLYKDLIENLKLNLNDRFILKVLAPGENTKHISNINPIYEFLVENNITRKDCIVAFGGGVVGDFAGFIASTYMRGIDFIQIPTTLLAQVDSSVGGKVAVNLDSGKNLVGSFYQPKLVIIDPEFLDTLSDRYFSDGLAEVIKYGMIRDKSIIEMLESCDGRKSLIKHIEDIIEICCKIKKDIVSADEKENGIRAILNYGHTIAHSIEKLGHYSKYSHGEAVGIGMKYMIESSIRRGNSDREMLIRFELLLQKYNLPSNCEYSGDELILELQNDKKFEGDNIKLIFADQIGDCNIIKVKRNEIKYYLFG